jgi:hypothetical protein
MLFYTFFNHLESLPAFASEWKQLHVQYRSRSCITKQPINIQRATHQKQTTLVVHTIASTAKYYYFKTAAPAATPHDTIQYHGDPSNRGLHVEQCPQLCE